MWTASGCETDAAPRDLGSSHPTTPWGTRFLTVAIDTTTVTMIARTNRQKANAMARFGNACLERAQEGLDFKQLPAAS